MQYNNIKNTVIDPADFELVGTKILVWLHQIPKLDKDGENKKTKGGILIPQSSDYDQSRVYQTSEGIVIKYGPKIHNIEEMNKNLTHNKIRVIFDGYCGWPVYGIDDFHYKIIDETDILGYNYIK